MMDVEERVRLAIAATREILMDIIDNPIATVIMTRDCVKPEDVENQVAMILEYLDRTKPEEAEG